MQPAAARGGRAARILILVAVLSAVLGGGATAGEDFARGLAGLSLPEALQALQDGGLNILSLIHI